MFGIKISYKMISRYWYVEKKVFLMAEMSLQQLKSFDQKCVIAVLMMRPWYIYTVQSISQRRGGTRQVSFSHAIFIIMLSTVSRFQHIKNAGIYQIISTREEILHLLRIFRKQKYQIEKQINRKINNLLRVMVEKSRNALYKYVS